MAQQVCLFKDANHLCGEPAVGTITIGRNRSELDDVPGCDRHFNAMLSSAQAARLMGTKAEGETPPPSIAEGAQTAQSVQVSASDSAGAGEKT